MNLSKHFLNINSYIECSEVEGPGKRFCIWVQGCNIGCNNCINEQMLSFEAKNILEVDELKKLILVAKNNFDIEGITLLGGEPFLQAKSLSIIAKYCHSIGLSVIGFSGFKYENILRNCVPYSSELINFMDVLIDGKYDEAKQDTTRNWVGSLNQKFYYLSEKYDKSIEKDSRYKNTIEIRISQKLYVNGDPFVLSKVSNDISVEN